MQWLAWANTQTSQTRSSVRFPPRYGGGELYFCATDGGAKKLGQIFRLIPGIAGAADRLDLFLESTDPSKFNFGGNLTVQDNGHLIVCEDGYDGEVNHLRGVTLQGAVYPLGRLNMETELAGACFSPLRAVGPRDIQTR
ncbi:DUF839 domain-containing protein [Erythrobacter sp.]|nr:DUF839 domain-containing protein [Erythrobacter sp.]